jgi:Na+/H+ antiporter NhaC
MALLKNSILRAKLLVAAVAVAAASGAAMWLAPDAADGSEGVYWYSILPPLLAVTLAFLTARIIPSLAAAVIAGGFLAMVPDAPLSPMSWARGLAEGPLFMWRSAVEQTNVLILAYVFFVIAMIAILAVSGGLHGIALWLSRFAKGRRSAQVSTALLGLVFFIDDYANVMLVGSTMRPMTDRHRVSREKLAFLVDATSAPVAGLAVVSTWVGYQVSLLDTEALRLEIGVSGYTMLLDSIVFRFYCLLMLFFVFVCAMSGRDFGPMARAERRALDEGLLAADDAVAMTSASFSVKKPDSASRVLARTALVPLGLMLSILLGGIWLDGGGLQVAQERPGALLTLTGWRGILSASQNSIQLLALSSGCALIIAALCAAFWARCKPPVIARAALSGMKSSALPMVILLLAWSLKEACTTLHTGEFLVAAMGESLSPMWFPAATFFVAILTSFATGTSFGTMAILVPTAFPIAHHLDADGYGLVSIMTVAAILDGSIVGDHCSPISDTTIMSSIASSCDHLHHVRTQIPYSASVAAVALGCGYIPLGMGLPPWAGLLVAAPLIVGLLFLLSRKTLTLTLSQRERE